MSAPDTNARSPAPRTTIDVHVGIGGERAEDARYRDLHVVRHRVEARRVVVGHPADAALHVRRASSRCRSRSAWSRSSSSLLPLRGFRTAPIVCSSSISAASYPSSASTSRVCAPSAGGPLRIRAGVSLNVSGGRSTSTSPRVGCSTRWVRPRCSTCGSANTSSTASTGPQGTTSARRSTHSAVVRARQRAREVGVERGAVLDARREGRRSEGRRRARARRPARRTSRSRPWRRR